MSEGGDPLWPSTGGRPGRMDLIHTYTKEHRQERRERNSVRGGKEERRLIEQLIGASVLLRICQRWLQLVAPARVSQDDESSCRTPAQLSLLVCVNTHAAALKRVAEQSFLENQPVCEGGPVFHLYPSPL